MSTNQSADLTIRILGRADRARLRRLAERDSATIPPEPVLGAERDGSLIAAVPLTKRGAGPIADPFVPSAAAVELLRLRAGQLRCDDGDGAGGPPLLRRLRARAAGSHPPVVLSGSPPGGGGRLLRL